MSAVASLITRACTITRTSESGTTDAYGNDIPGESEVSTVVEVQQRRRDEPDDQGDLSDTDWEAFFLPSETVRAGDTLTVDAEVYQVVGEPWRVWDPHLGDYSHIEASLRRTVGPEDEVAS